MRKYFLLVFQDLRVCIGFFFCIMSLVLLIASVFFPDHVNHDVNLNFFASIFTGIFGLFMVLLGFLSEVFTSSLDSFDVN